MEASGGEGYYRVMRVAIFTATYYPTVNGVSHCVSFYAKGLQARGHEPVIFAPCPDDWDPKNDPDNVLRFPSIPLPMDWDYHIAMPFSRRVVQALHRTSFDIVHTQHPVWVGAWGQAYARWANIPLVTTVHTEYQLFAHVVPLPEPLVDAYLNSRVRNYCNKCEVVTCAVPSMRKRLIERGVTVPVEILPNPTELERFSGVDGSGVRKQHGIGPEDLVIGYIGRLSAEKNLHFLFEAVALVLKSVPGTWFMVVGSGPEARALKRLARKLQIVDRTVFVGNVEHDAIPPYQAALDVFAAASLSETQPLAYTEAMACRKPLVAVRAPGAEDMVEHEKTGLLVEHKDGPQGMAQTLRRVLEDKQLRERLGNNAHRWVQQFDLPRVTDRLLEIYQLARERFEVAD